VLLLEESPVGMAVLVQLLKSCGALNIHQCMSVAEAEKVVATTSLDLMIVDSLGISGAGYDFVKWFRNSGIKPNCYIPVLLIAARTSSSSINKARDCGANLVMAKPVGPTALVERIAWISREGQMFVESETYVGPDRRFRTGGLPMGIVGRRHDD